MTNVCALSFFFGVCANYSVADLWGGQCQSFITSLN